MCLNKLDYNGEPLRCFKNMLVHSPSKIFFSILRALLKRASGRSSDRRCSVKKGVLRNFAKFTGKHLCQSLFFNKAETCNFIKKETLAKVFLYEFCEIPTSTIFTEHLWATASFRHIYFRKSAIKVLIKYRGSNWYYDASANSTSQSGECHENKCFNNDKFKSLKEPNLSGRTFCGNENQSPKVLF